MSTEKAYLAGGCFWGMEELFRHLPGVLSTEVGYAGGSTENPQYKEVSSGRTGHAESLMIEFNPQTISFQELLLFFFKIHNPTTPNQQGNDRGTQYRSVIFYTSESQRQVAEDTLQKVNASGAWGAEAVTEVRPLERFYPAETYHQDYLQKEPQGYTCHYIRPLKF